MSIEALDRPDLLALRAGQLEPIDHLGVAEGVQPLPLEGTDVVDPFQVLGRVQRHPSGPADDIGPVLDADGNPDTAWCSFGSIMPDVYPEWIRIDLPIELSHAPAAARNASVSQNLRACAFFTESRRT